MSRKPTEGQESSFNEEGLGPSFEAYKKMIAEAEKRMDQLVDKEGAGKLTEPERVELESTRAFILRIESLPGYYDAALAEKVNRGSDVVQEREELSEAKTKIHKELEDLVVGQPEAVERMANFIHSLKSASTNPDNKMALGSFFFVGPSGVGKDWTVEAFLESLTEGKLSNIDQERIIHIDGNSLDDGEQSLNRLIGSPSGFVGSSGHSGYQSPLLARLRNDETKIMYPLYKR